MKKYLTILTFFTSSLVCFSQEYNFPEPILVRSKLTIQSIYRDGGESKDTVSLTTFNSFGKPIREIQYLDTLGLIIKNYHYNSENQLTGIDEYGRTPTDVYRKSDGSYSIILDSDSTFRGRKSFRILDSYRIRESNYTDDQLRSIKTITKDNQGIIIKEIRKELLLPKPNTYKVEYRYSNNARMGNYSFNGELTGYDTTFYLNNQISRVVNYLTNGEKISEVNYIYDSQNRLLEFQYDSNCKNLYGGYVDYCGNIKYVYGYDQDGIISFKKTYFDDELVSILKFEYN